MTEQVSTAEGLEHFTLPKDPPPLLENETVPGALPSTAVMTTALHEVDLPMVRLEGLQLSDMLVGTKTDVVLTVVVVVVVGEMTVLVETTVVVD